jgi:hypothetical protein
VGFEVDKVENGEGYFYENIGFHLPITILLILHTYL